MLLSVTSQVFAYGFQTGAAWLAGARFDLVFKELGIGKIFPSSNRETDVKLQRGRFHDFCCAEDVLILNCTLQ